MRASRFLNCASIPLTWEGRTILPADRITHAIAFIRDARSRGASIKRVAVILILALSTGLRVQAGSNLVVNGSFDAADRPLQGWRYQYDAPGESWYADNPKYVSVLVDDAGRKGVLRLHGTYALLQVPGQGVKVDSLPIPADMGRDRFRLTVSARSTGPTCRILVEGYRWAPGVPPHNAPRHTELRKCYKFSQVYFGSQEAGEMALLTPAWQQGTIVFPTANPTALARAKLAQIQFVVIHIVAIGGSEGDLLVDDVHLERLP